MSAWRAHRRDEPASLSHGDSVCRAGQWWFIDNPTCLPHRPPHLQRLHALVHLPETEPVNIPRPRPYAHRRPVLPYGFEIYSLLTRWGNPLNRPPGDSSVQRPQRAVVDSALPATPGALPGDEGFRRGGLTGWIEPLPVECSPAREAASAADRGYAETWGAAGRAHAGRIWRRLRIRHSKRPVGQELPAVRAHRAGAGAAPALLRRGAFRRTITIEMPSTFLASITSPSPRGRNSHVVRQ